MDFGLTRPREMLRKTVEDFAAKEIAPIAQEIDKCEAALEVTSQALQVFGTYGYTADFPLERYFRDARGLMLVAQPMELRKLVLGKLRLGVPLMGPPPGVPPGGPPGRP